MLVQAVDMDVDSNEGDTTFEDVQAISDVTLKANQSHTWRDHMGLVRDGIGAMQPAVDVGFGIALKSIGVGFTVAKAGVSLLNVVKGGQVISTPVNAALDMAHGITKKTVNLTKNVTDLSIWGADATVGYVTRAEKGEVLRRLRAYVESSSGQTDSRFVQFEHKEALLMVCTLLVELQGRLTVKDPFLLLEGARRLALVHEARRARRITQRREAQQVISEEATSNCIHVPTRAKLENFRSYMNFAAAAHAPSTLVLHGIVDLKSMAFDQDMVLLELTGIPSSDVLHVFHGGTRELYRPTHLVVLDRRNRQVVLTIGGTQTVGDVVVDLVCETETFLFQARSSSQQSEVIALSGFVHRGMLRSAQRLAGDLHELVMEALRENPSYQLVVTGHSLGAGVATLLTLLWSQIPEFASKNIHAFAFAAPCTVSSEISQHPYVRNHVTSIVTADDIVSRLGIATFRELQSHMVALAKCSETDSLEHYEQVLQGLVGEDLGDEKLFCAGQVWWLESPETDPHPIVEIDPVKVLNAMELFSDVVTVHMPKPYMETLARLSGSGDR